MIKISAIGHAHFETPDLGRLTDYYNNVLGLQVVAKDAQQAFLACPLDHHSVVLKQGSQAACTTLALQLAADVDLGDFERQLASHGVSARRRSDPEPGIPSVVEFDDPKGTRVCVYNEPAVATPIYPDRGIASLKLGHIAFNATDVRKVVDFYCDVLGFQFSDSIEDFFVWLRCSPEHHAVNFVKGERVKMHHIAFEVRDWSHIQTACDFLSKNKYPIIWGPGRHGCGHNLFAYHRDPDGQIVEIFAEMDRMRDDLGYFEPRPWHRERPQKPKIWPADPAASNLWGPMPSADFLD